MGVAHRQAVGRELEHIPDRLVRRRFLLAALRSAPGPG